MTKENDGLYNLEFAVEVSTLYHEWRRSSFEFWATFIRACTLIGAVVALLSLFPPSEWFLYLAGFASAFVALVTLCDLVFRIDYKARLHTDLYRRFKRLQVEIVKNRDDWQAHINEWSAEAQTIRVDEPSVLWLIYMQVWNQALGKRKVNEANFRRITFWQSVWGHFYPYRPQDFPLVGASRA